jgi:flagellar biosynthesis protein FlhG
MPKRPKLAAVPAPGEWPAQDLDKQPVRVIAVASGKGGVGKTTVAVNIAVALAEQGRRVALLDADLGLANVDVMLGLDAGLNLSDLIAGHCALPEILLPAPGGIWVVPGASGDLDMASLSAQGRAGLVNAFNVLGDHLDVLLVDTAAGLAASVLDFCTAAHQIVLVIGDDPASLADAQALMRALRQRSATARIHILANMAESPDDGRALFARIARETDDLLDARIDFLGTLTYDPDIRRSAKHQEPLLLSYPHGASARTLRALARQLEDWPVPRDATGRLEFFVERVLEPRAIKQELPT